MSGRTRVVWISAVTPARADTSSSVTSRISELPRQALGGRAQTSGPDYVVSRFSVILRAREIRLFTVCTGMR